MTINRKVLKRSSRVLLVLVILACSRQATDTVALNGTVHSNEIIEEPSADDIKDKPMPPIRTKENILAYFDTLIAEKKILVGQHCGDGPDLTNTYYQEYVSRLAGKTNKYVGIVGADLGYFPSKEYPVNTLIDHWEEGGLVTLSWHADNPFENNYDAYSNSVENIDTIDLKALLKSASESAVKTSYRKELDEVAGALQELRDSGVTVIWRPFHEMNGDFFWWGINAYNNKQTNTSQFKALWKDLYNTLTYDYGLDNLIWTYAVIPYVGWNAEVTSFYPGSDYVDLVGMDYYGETPDFPDYSALKSLGKTIVMSETGPNDRAYGNWNEVELVYALAGKAAYFLQWHSWSGAAVAIKDNRKANDMMNSNKAITRDEIAIQNSN